MIEECFHRLQLDGLHPNFDSQPQRARTFGHAVFSRCPNICTGRLEVGRLLGNGNLEERFVNSVEDNIFELADFVALLIVAEDMLQVFYTLTALLQATLFDSFYKSQYNEGYSMMAPSGVPKASARVTSATISNHLKVFVSRQLRQLRDESEPLYFIVRRHPVTRGTLEGLLY